MANAVKSILCLAGIVAIATPAIAAPDFSPNASVGWVALSTEFQRPPSGPGPLLQDPAHPRVTNEEFRRTGRQPTLPIADLSNPILQPWAREDVRRHNALALTGNGGLSPGASCRPLGTPAFLTHVIHPVFFVQAPKEVVMVWQGDGEIRHIYLGDKHSDHVKPSYSGESIGHYEGDELVVDTIGLSPKTFIDNYYTPHTDHLRVVERFRLTDGGNRLEARIHVEDPGAFTTPWDAVQRWRRVEPGRADDPTPVREVGSAFGAGPLMEVRCAENPGTYFGGEAGPIPHADPPDF